MRDDAWYEDMTRPLCSPLFYDQGVTLTDLQEAEKTMKTDNKGRETKKEEEEKEAAKQKKAEEGVRTLFQRQRGTCRCNM